jgi:FkbM family methyltransferase
MGRFVVRLRATLFICACASGLEVTILSPSPNATINAAKHEPIDFRIRARGEPTDDPALDVNGDCSICVEISAFPAEAPAKSVRFCTLASEKLYVYPGHLTPGRLVFSATLSCGDWYWPGSNATQWPADFRSAEHTLNIQRGSEPAPSLLFGDAGVRVGETRHGPMMWFNSDRLVGTSLRRHGEWESGVARILCGMVQWGDVAIDAGAHVGSMSLPLARCVGEQGAVLAVEAQGPMLALLSANAASNLLLQIRPIRALVSSVDGGTAPVNRMTLTHWSNLAAVSFTDGSTGGTATGNPRSVENTTADADDSATPLDQDQVEKRSLDGLVRELVPPSAAFPDRCVTLIKIDIEGMEQEALAGAAGVIARCQPALHVEAQCARATPPVLEHIVNTLQYECWWDLQRYTPESPWLVGLVGDDVPRDDWKIWTSLSANIVCLPQGSGGAHTPRQRVALDGLFPRASRAPVVEPWALPEGAGTFDPSC